jgi:hypothetical protein
VGWVGGGGRGTEVEGGEGTAGREIVSGGEVEVYGND